MLFCEMWKRTPSLASLFLLVHLDHTQSSDTPWNATGPVLLNVILFQAEPHPCVCVYHVVYQDNILLGRMRMNSTSHWFMSGCIVVLLSVAKVVQRLPSFQILHGWCPSCRYAMSCTDSMHTENVQSRGSHPTTCYNLARQNCPTGPINTICIGLRPLAISVIVSINLLIMWSRYHYP